MKPMKYSNFFAKGHKSRIEIKQLLNFPEILTEIWILAGILLNDETEGVTLQPILSIMAERERVE